MIICLSGFVIAGASAPSMSALRSDALLAAPLSCERSVYAPHQQQLLQHFAPPAPPLLAALPALPALLAHRGGARCSSSSESVSSHSASPPPAPLAHARLGRVRTLYACLGESEGELSFEPNQIITNVTPSAEPGWLRGTLNGQSGLVPENYVEPLP